jgi:hypothetical protein
VVGADLCDEAGYASTFEHRQETRRGWSPGGQSRVRRERRERRPGSNQRGPPETHPD